MCVRILLAYVTVNSAGVYQHSDGSAIIHCNQAMKEHCQALGGKNANMAQVIGQPVWVDQSRVWHDIAWLR